MAKSSCLMIGSVGGGRLHLASPPVDVDIFEAEFLSRCIDRFAQRIPDELPARLGRVIALPGPEDFHGRPAPQYSIFRSSFTASVLMPERAVMRSGPVQMSAYQRHEFVSFAMQLMTHASSDSGTEV